MHVEKEETQKVEITPIVVPVTINATLKLNPDGSFEMLSDNNSWEALVVSLLESKKALEEVLKGEEETRADNKEKLKKAKAEAKKKGEKGYSVNLPREMKESLFIRHQTAIDVLGGHSVALLQKMFYTLLNEKKEEAKEVQKELSQIEESVTEQEQFDQTASEAFESYKETLKKLDD